jgi:hypothetical protein
VRPADTSPEARRVQVEAWRRMTGEERLLLAFQLSEDVRRIAEAGRARREAVAAGR